MRGVREPFPTIPTLTSQNGRTALHHACEKDHVTVVEELIDKHGANVEAVDKVRSGGIRTCIGGYDVSWATAVPVFTTCLPSSEPGTNLALLRSLERLITAYSLTAI